MADCHGIWGNVGETQNEEGLHSVWSVRETKKKKRHEFGLLGCASHALGMEARLSGVRVLLTPGIEADLSGN